MIISIPPNGGLIPKLSDKMLPVGAALKAVNVDLRSGLVAPLKDLGSSVGEGDVSIYLDKDVWRTWPFDVDVVSSPVSQSRIIYTDGVLPKIRDVGLEYPLGIPRPTNAPLVSTTDLSNLGLTFTWNWFYEDSGGLQYDMHALAGAPVETVIGGTYTLNTIPPPVTAPSGAKFILWCSITDAKQNKLGHVIPSPSLSVEKTDAVVNGALLSAALVISGTTATFTFNWDSSNVTSFQTIRAYVYTYVRTWPSDGATDEGPPSDISAEIPVNPARGVILSELLAPPSGYGITAIRIYRTVSGVSGTAFIYVGEITLGDISSDTLIDLSVADGKVVATDTLTDTAIASSGPLRSIQYDPPPATLRGLRYHPGGFLVGFIGNSVYFSEPYQPHAWPSYSIACDYNVVGLGVVGQTVVVVTEGHSVMMTGNTPLSIGVTKVNNSLSGTAKRAVVETGYSVIYATPAGLVEQPGGQLITAQLYTKEQWQLLAPTTMQLAWSDNRLFIITKDHGMKILRMDGGVAELTETDDEVIGYFVSLATDTLYLSQLDSIYPWGNGEARTYTYQTKTYSYPIAVSPACYRLTAEAEGGVVVMSLYGDGVLYYCDTITSGDVRWLPTLPRAREWSVKVMGDCVIRELVVSDSVKLL